MSIELPKDAEGREIPLDTKALYDANGDTREVQAFEFSVIDGMWRVQFLGNFIFFYTNDMHLTPPDSWEKLEEDLKRAANSTTYECCAYLGGNGTECASCEANDENTCEKFVMENIASRIRKLRGEG